MFLDEDASGQNVDRIVVTDWHRGLDNDRPAVKLAGHEVNRRAAQLYTVIQRLALGVHARERWQKRRVNIEDGIRECVEQPRSDEPHEPSETDQRYAAGS